MGALRNKENGYINSQLDEINLNKAIFESVDLGDSTPYFYYNKTTKALTAGSFGYKYFEPFSVVANEIYRISGLASYSANLYIMLDADENIVSVYPDTSISDKEYKNKDFKIPSNVVTLLINDMTGITLLEKFVSYEKETFKIGIIGDSLSDRANGYTPNQYDNYLENIDGYEINNVAYSGSGYRRKYDTTQAMYQRALTLDSDCTDVFMMGSFNDISEIAGGFSIGTLGDTGATVSIYGAIYTTITNIQTTCPDARLVVASPPPWVGYKPTDAVGSNQILYVKAIEETSYLLGVKFLDLFRLSGVRPWNATFLMKYFYKSDGIHLNGLGHEKYLYPYIRRALGSAK